MSAIMIKEFRLPDLGEGLTESEILSWKVNVGDTVALNQIIAEVETAKAVVEIPSPFAGVVAALHEQPGTVVEVGKPIVSFEVEDAAGVKDTAGAEDTAAAKDTAEAEDAAAADDGGTSPVERGAPTPTLPRREPNLVGYGVAPEPEGHPVRRPRVFASAMATDAPTPAAPAASATAAAAPTPAVHNGDRPRSTPPVRKLAKDLGVDLHEVSGTGHGGLITRDDVRGFADKAPGVEAVPSSVPPAAAVTLPPSGVRETRTPIKGVRKYTAAAMVSSAFTAPHVTEFLTVDVTAGMELLERLKASREFAGHKLTPLTLVAKALLVALRRNPTLNSHWDDANQEIVQFHYVNLGIAAATPRGLLVPNIKDAQDMGLLELSEALASLTETARAGKSTPEDLSHGTISITNIGVFGIDAGTPILNPGEAAILSIGAVRPTPWEHNGEIALRQVMTLSLSFDHRLVDGEQGSRFLADVGAVLRDPGMVLTMV
ncbi:dihydrolipoamide acetyltransferase family protein [Arthrobacter sp. M4]|uniref:dihydrolipoamide acetyltransferase family protein n=1 Tax=Arthrobacter sp. M4 TaxID=218160 RepID=UPI001CDC04B7|nr:dihydrolipoamide acetyltransferase family protein [Arthrobacter sp. M4]MCA4133737.1 2-oxo acid dehydrogenase subunit E2 [Arthrobacter sp. M4]